jgi:hypothetical protein
VSEQFVKNLDLAISWVKLIEFIEVIYKKGIKSHTGANIEDWILSLVYRVWFSVLEISQPSKYLICQFLVMVDEVRVVAAVIAVPEKEHVFDFVLKL